MKDIQQNIEMVTTSGGVDSFHGREWWHSDFLLLREVLEILITQIMKIYEEDDNEADDPHYSSVLRQQSWKMLRIWWIYPCKFFGDLG